VSGEAKRKLKVGRRRRRKREGGRAGNMGGEGGTSIEASIHLRTHLLRFLYRSRHLAAAPRLEGALSAFPPCL